MDEIDFKKLFANAASLYPNPGLSEGSASAYYAHLRGHVQARGLQLAGLLSECGTSA
jgi:hypothetical protein